MKTLKLENLDTTGNFGEKKQTKTKNKHGRGDAVTFRTQQARRQSQD